MHCRWPARGCGGKAAFRVSSSNASSNASRRNLQLAVLSQTLALLVAWLVVPCPADNKPNQGLLYTILQTTGSSIVYLCDPRVIPWRQFFPQSSDCPILCTDSGTILRCSIAGMNALIESPPMTQSLIDRMGFQGREMDQNRFSCGTLPG